MLYRRYAQRSAKGSKKAKPTVGELAGDLIGCVEGPGDLTTNPKYIAGYGR